MATDVDSFEQDGHWHWQIIGPLGRPDGRAGTESTLVECCTDKGGSCEGFKTKADAKHAGNAYVEAHRID
jgi:hypothetical protein